MLRRCAVCLILFGHRAHPEFDLVLAANRDEFFARPAAAADYWTQDPGVLGGRDLEKGGTWMGVTRTGRWAALTNYRDGSPAPADARSRGQLVSDYLLGDESASGYAASRAGSARLYAGFNLLAGDAEGIYYLSHADAAPIRVAPGIHGLSNHRLDTSWPKVDRGRQALRSAMRGSADRIEESLLALLADDALADDALLPATGIPADWEKKLSAAFIRAPGYGTRASSVLLVGRDGQVSFRERTFGPGGAMSEDRMFRFSVTTATS